MICAGEPGEKASFPGILAIVSAEERLARLKVDNQTFFYHIYIFSDQFIDLFYFCSRLGCDSHNPVRINIPP